MWGLFAKHEEERNGLADYIFIEAYNEADANAIFDTSAGILNLDRDNYDLFLGHSPETAIAIWSTYESIPTFYDFETMKKMTNVMIIATGRSLKNRIIMPNGVDGMICTSCKEFYSYAEPNQENGTMKCYNCRNSGA